MSREPSRTRAAGHERPGPRQGRSALLYAPSDPGQDPRHVGTIETLWNLFDLTPEGRPIDWNEQLAYR